VDLSGDPGAIRNLAARLRLAGQSIAVVMSRAQDRSSLPNSRGPVVDRVRDSLTHHRQRAARLEGRMSVLADDLDRMAASLEQAQQDAALARAREAEESAQ